MADKKNRFNKDAVIVAQNATMPAVQLCCAIIAANDSKPTTTESALALYDQVHQHVFEQSMLMGGVDSVESFLEAEPAPSRGTRTNSDPGSVAFRGSGKHAGKTIAEVHAEDPEYLTWAITEKGLRNQYMVQQIRAFLGQQS